MTDNGDPAIAPLELFLDHEIPRAGLDEMVVYDQVASGHWKRCLGHGALLISSITVLMTVSAIPFAFALILWLMVFITAIESGYALCTLAFGPKVWQTLPPGRTIASAKLEETARQEAAAWNVEAARWNASLASWTDEYKAWKGSDHPSSHVRGQLSEQLGSLWTERLALLDRRDTVRSMISPLNRFLPPPSDPDSNA